MSTPKKADRPNGQGVLSNLPRTRPQRSSPRRAAARKAGAAAATAATAPASANGRPAAGAKATAKRASQRPAPAPKRPRAASKRPVRPPEPGEERVPRQGFECESERASGPVSPPGGTELVASAAEIISELAKAGLSSGERLLKDVLSRLPLA
jgi:hypothetical protein